MDSKRLVFKFYKSYYDVATELSDKDRLAFYDAIMKRQFFGIEPKLNGIVKFAYISQKHNIDKQVKGWEDFTKNKLIDNQSDNNPIIPTVIDPIIGCMIDPMIQLKEKEKEKEEEEIKYTVFSFADFWKMYGKSADKIKCQKLYDKITEKEREDIKVKLPIYLSTIKDKKFQKNPHTYLYGKCWNDIDDVSEMQNEDESQETLKELYPNCFWQINSKKIYYKPDWAK